MSRFGKGSFSEDDQVAYDLMRAGDQRGWEMLYRKYSAPKHYRRHLSGGSLSEEQKADVWVDAMEDLYIQVRRGNFKRQQDGQDFMLPGLIVIARRKAKARMQASSKRLVEDITDNTTEGALEETKPEDWEEKDMLLLRICIEQLQEPRRSIILWKYMPEEPENANLTDADVRRMLQHEGKALSLEHLGVERRRALVQVGKWYQEIRKQAVETHLQATDQETYAVVNVHFPTDALWNRLHQSKTNDQWLAVHAHLQVLQKEESPTVMPRRWLYASVAKQYLLALQTVGSQEVLREKLNQWWKTTKAYFSQKR